MPWNYARAKIDEALINAKGNTPAAARVIMNAALNDARLLVELAGPHLKGIVAHAVAHVIRDQERAKAGPTPPPAAPESLNMPLDEFGRDLLGALSGRDTPHFGHEVYGGTSGPPKQASQAHIDLMKKLARKETK
jgi:hypothetical protein